MKTYTKQMAQQATRNQMKASYVNVWEWLSGDVVDRETAKENIFDFANEQGINVNEIFEDYKESVDGAMQEMELSGYFCF